MSVNSEKVQATRRRFDFLTPFIVVVCLLTPSMLVLAVTKGTAGYSAIVNAGYFAMLEVVMWILMIIAAVSTVGYLVLARSWVGRLIVAGLFVILSLLFVYLTRG